MLALPHDPAIETLDPVRRARVASVWAARSAAEEGAAENFRLIARSFREAGAGQELVTIADRSIEDEIGHAALCRKVATAYAGHDVVPPPPASARFPTFAGATPELVALLHTVGNCCFNETIACAFLELCLQGARGPMVCAALRQLLSDDVDHARLGWSCLTSTLAREPSLAAPLSELVLQFAKMNLRMWSRSTGEEIVDPEHGCPALADVNAAVSEAFHELILPGLARAGVDVTATRSWLATAMPT
jgi:hypothetical protein